MSAPSVVVVLCVGRAKALAPEDVIGGVDGAVVVEVAGWLRDSGNAGDEGQDAVPRDDCAVVPGPRVCQLGVVGPHREWFRPHDGVAVRVGREERTFSY